MSISYRSGCSGELLKPPCRTEELISPAAGKPPSVASPLQVALVEESSIYGRALFLGAAGTQCVVSVEVERPVSPTVTILKGHPSFRAPWVGKVFPATAPELSFSIFSFLLLSLPFPSTGDDPGSTP